GPAVAFDDCRKAIDLEDREREALGYPASVLPELREDLGEVAACRGARRRCRSREAGDAAPQTLLGGDILLRAEDADRPAMLIADADDEAHPALIAIHRPDPAIEREALSGADGAAAMLLHLAPGPLLVEIEGRLAVDI